jgi:predicted acetyltransferase
VRYTLGVQLRSIATEEVDRFLEAVMFAFHAELRPDDRGMWAKVLEPERTLVWEDGGRFVANAGAFSRRMTVPGGELAVAAVTAVGVAPTHRRRGLLTAMMRRQLDELHDGGEAVAVLKASEGAIYGRFGYAPATHVLRITAQRAMVRWREAHPQALRLADPAEAIAQMRPVHASVRAARPGMLDRDGEWWPDRVYDPEHDRRGSSPLRAVVGDDGYALYAVASEEPDGFPDGRVRVRELVARTPAARAALWAFLLDLDLTSTLLWPEAPSDEPLALMLADPDAARSERQTDLWLRLVDVPRALAARGYDGDPDVVLEVADTFCPWNAGRWRLAGGACEAVGAEPDLALDVTALAAAYLGGTTLAELAAAGRVSELRPGALKRASDALRGAVAPWSPDGF